MMNDDKKTHCNAFKKQKNENKIKIIAKCHKNE